MFLAEDSCLVMIVSNWSADLARTHGRHGGSMFFPFQQDLEISYHMLPYFQKLTMHNRICKILQDERIEDVRPELVVYKVNEYERFLAK